MPQVLPQHRVRREPHPLENSLAVITLVGGLVALVTGLVHSTHLVGSATGVAAFALGLYSQLISATTSERWLNVIGMGAAFVGAGMAFRHGGFTI